MSFVFSTAPWAPSAASQRDASSRVSIGNSIELNLSAESTNQPSYCVANEMHESLSQKYRKNLRNLLNREK